MPREALIWRTNSGISSTRMTTTSATMDSTQVHPPAGSMPRNVSASCACTMIQATATFSGHSTVSKKPICRLGLLRSEEHTSELQSRGHLVCRLLLEKKKDALFQPEP